MPITGGTEIEDTKVDTRSAKPNLQQLLMPSKFHPRGRIQIDPTTGMPRNPKNNVIYYKEKLIKHEPSGLVLAVQKFPVNGGHVKKSGSVWRIGLRGPTKHHMRVLQEDQNFRLKGKTERVAVELTTDEAKEYAAYVTMLKEQGKQISNDKDFYKWFAGKKVVVKDREVFIVPKTGAAMAVPEPAVAVDTNAPEGEGVAGGNQQVLADLQTVDTPKKKKKKKAPAKAKATGGAKKKKKKKKAKKA